MSTSPAPAAFTVVICGHMRMMPSVVHSHLEHIYLPHPDSRVVVCTWPDVWDTTPIDHHKFRMKSSPDLLPRWMEPITLGWKTVNITREELEARAQAWGVPPVNRFHQLTWRSLSYCHVIQEAARLAQASSPHELFLFCRPDLRFEGDLNPHLPEGFNCACNIGVDWFPDGSRKIGRAGVYGMECEGFLDQLFLVDRRGLRALCSIYDSIGKMNARQVEVNNETLIGWHLHLSGLKFTSFDLAPITLVRPRCCMDGLLRLVFPGHVDRPVEF